MSDLPVKIRRLDDIPVHEAKSAYPGTSDVSCGWATEAAGTNDEDLRGLEPLLTCEPVSWIFELQIIEVRLDHEFQRLEGSIVSHIAHTPRQSGATAKPVCHSLQGTVLDLALRFAPRPVQAALSKP